MRYRPLNPGPWRRAARDYTLGAGTWRATRIREGRLVLASTQSAMFDPRGVREPGRFDPGRDAADSMLFGYGLHWCVGKFIAEAQIAQTLKPLLLRPDLRRAPGSDGKLALLGLFPEHLFVEWGTAPGVEE
jgi:cytochrome P450